MPDKSISEDEVSECISGKVDEGVPLEQAVAICLSEAEEGSTEPENQQAEYEVGETTVDITPPDQMVNAAEAAQQAQEEGLIPSECGTGVGDRRADQIVNDNVGPDVIDEIASYLTSHEEDVTAEGSPTDWNEEEWNDCGNAQYAKWGGVNDGEMKRWAQGKANEVAEAQGEELPYPERDSKQASFQFEVGDWVQWEFSDGTSQGQITDRENEPGESLSAQGSEREATEEEPVYKMDEWDEEEMELTNDVVKSQSELTQIDEPEQASKTVDTMNPEEREERRQEIIENREDMKTASFQVTGKDIDIVKEPENKDGEIVVNVPIQALSEDRDGDFINEKGQESIIRQLKSGTVPLMLNHGVGSSAAMYDARDIIGQFVDGDKRNGTTIGTARMRKDKDGENLHRDAEEVVDLLEQDMPIGFSVGFIPTEKEPREKGDGEEGMEISDLDLMEVSAVGIPSNPDAVPQAMESAVAMAKNAGLSKNDIENTLRKAFEDTMSEKQNEDGTDQKEQKQDLKSEEQSFKQITEDDINAIMGTIGGALDAHMDEAMSQMEDDLRAMADGEMEDEEETPDETDVTDEDEEDEEEMNTEPEKQDSQEEEKEKDGASDHTEDGKSSESENSEEKEKVPNSAEKNQSDNQDIEQQEEKETETEKKKQVDELAEISAEKGEMWS